MFLWMILKNTTNLENKKIKIIDVTIIITNYNSSFKKKEMK